MLHGNLTMHQHLTLSLTVHFPFPLLTSLPPSLNSSLSPPSLPHSLPQSLPLSSIPPFHPPSLSPQSLPPFLPPSLQLINDLLQTKRISFTISGGKYQPHVSIFSESHYTAVSQQYHIPVMHCREILRIRWDTIYY